MKQNFNAGRANRKTATEIVCFDWQVDASVTILIHKSPAAPLAAIPIVQVRNRNVVFEPEAQNRLELSLFH